MKATVVLPIKRFARAKTRVVETIGPPGRAALLRAMLADVLVALDGAREIERVILVTGEGRAEKIAMERAKRSTTPLEVLREPTDNGHSEAATLGIIRAKALGAECAALLPGDCPLIDPGELDAAIATLREGTVGVAADRHGTGTNGLFLAPADAIGPAFGPGSRERHLDRARQGRVQGGGAARSPRLRSTSTPRRTWLPSPRSSRTSPNGHPRPRPPSPSCDRDPPGRGHPRGRARRSARLDDRRRHMRSPPTTSWSSRRRSSPRRRAESAIWAQWRRLPGPRSSPPRSSKDPRLVELILAESRDVLRAERGVLIVETNSGLICANAGIDSSNVPGEGQVALLPEDSDESARRIRSEIERSAGVRPAVVVVDSFGRPWRLGQTEVAIGCAGLQPLDDWRGSKDREGKTLGATMIAIADEVAAGADLARDKASGAPVVVVSGLGRHITREDGPGAASLQRARDRDLFR